MVLQASSRTACLLGRGRVFPLWIIHHLGFIFKELGQKIRATPAACVLQSSCTFTSVACMLHINDANKPSEQAQGRRNSGFGRSVFFPELQLEVDPTQHHRTAVTPEDTALVTK